METMKKPGWITGGIVGILLTLPLVALFFLGSRLVGLPLVPLDLFDLTVPLIPGGLVTFVIDTMVDSIIALGLGANVDQLAKIVEQIMGMGMFVGIGAVLGALFFVALRSLEKSVYIAGLVFGAVLGVIFTFISVSHGFFDTGAVMAGLWIMVMFIAWGVALSWLYSDLTALPVKEAKPAASIDSEIKPRVHKMDRREFLVRVGGATATLTIIGAGLGVALGGSEEAPTVASTTGTNPDIQPEVPTDGTLPNADAAVQPAPGMRPEYTPVAEHYRIDIASRPVEIDLATWTLPFTGLIAQEREFTMDELRAFPAKDQYITLQCISNRIGGNLISTTRWTGVPVRDVLNELEIQENGKWLRINGGDGFFEYLSIDMIMEDDRIMFAYDFDGQPLPQRNGFPLRVYIPSRYGMKQPKWITSIEVVEIDDRGYWVRRGWSEQAIMQTTSVVDTIATNDLYRDADGTIRVPVGGFAIAGARGISKVEVRVDGGDWVEAQLRDPLSDKTWVFWRYDWAFEEGSHTFEVQAYEADGTLQPVIDQDVRPDGATGIHSASANITNTLEA